MGGMLYNCILCLWRLLNGLDEPLHPHPTGLAANGRRLFTLQNCHEYGIKGSEIALTSQSAMF